MELAEHIENLRTDGMLLADSAEATGLDAVPPTCPQWTVRELVRHIGEVHRWATGHVAGALVKPDLDFEALKTWPSTDQDLIPWYREGHALLLQTLENAPADLACWSFLPGGPTGVAFWARRQAHETAIHRVDAQLVTGTASPSAPDFAADGIDEILHGFFARRPSKVVSPTPLTFALTAPDVDRSWLVTIDPDGPSTVDTPGPAGPSTADTASPADATVRADAFDLYLLLWNRRTLDGLPVEGSPDALNLWRSLAVVNWT